MKKILLHICCGPCGTASVKRLQDEGYQVFGFYYNPNIHPKEENEKRLKGAKKLARDLDIELIVPKYSSEDYFNAIGMDGDCRVDSLLAMTEVDKSVMRGENIPKPSERCPKCWGLRIAKTAEKAKELEIGMIGSTLRISPYQDQSELLKIGQKIAKKYGLDFYDKELTDCFRESIQISKSQEMYRQKYCGCIFSKEYR